MICSVFPSSTHKCLTPHVPEVLGANQNHPLRDAPCWSVVSDFDDRISGKVGALLVTFSRQIVQEIDLVLLRARLPLTRHPDSQRPLCPPVVVVDC